MFGAPPAAEIRVYAAAGRLEGGEGAQIHVYAVAGPLGRPELSRLVVAVGWRAWSAPASVWAKDGGLQAAAARYIRTMVRLERSGLVVGGGWRPYVVEDVFELAGIVFERPTLKMVQKHWE